MIVSLEVSDNKAKAFLEFIRSLDFVSIQRTELGEKEEADLLKERLEEYHANPQDTVALKKLLADLKSKYEL
jgi:hypothetical protein